MNEKYKHQTHIQNRITKLGIVDASRQSGASCGHSLWPSHQETPYLHWSVMWNCQSIGGTQAAHFLWPEVWHGHSLTQLLTRANNHRFLFVHSMPPYPEIEWLKCSSPDTIILHDFNVSHVRCQSGKWIPGWTVCWQRSPHIVSHRPLVCPSKSLTDQFFGRAESAKRLDRLCLFVTVLNIQTPLLSLLTPDTTHPLTLLVKLHTPDIPPSPVTQETGGNGKRERLEK